MMAQDHVIETLQRQVEDLQHDIERLKTDLEKDLYGDERRHVLGLFERASQLEARQRQFNETLRAFERREEERAKNDQRRARAINTMLGAITAILTGFTVLALNQLFFGGGL